MVERVCVEGEREALVDIDCPFYVNYYEIVVERVYVEGARAVWWIWTAALLGFTMKSWWKGSM